MNATDGGGKQNQLIEELDRVVNEIEQLATKP
jgi:hypothetical protein